MEQIGERILKIFFFNYLILNDVNSIENLISESFVGIGASKLEVVKNKKEFLEKLRNKIESIDRKVTFYIDNYIEYNLGNIISSYCDLTVMYFNNEKRTVETRLTTTSFYEDGDWKIISMHNSIPELKQNKDEFFSREWILEVENLADIEIYLSGKFKRGFFKKEDINYITYSSVTRRSTFFLRNMSNFEIKRNFSEVEERLESIKSFYKLDRGTIVNIGAVEILDFKEERIIFKNKQILYVSKVKLKELESKWVSIKNNKNNKNIEF